MPAPLPLRPRSATEIVDAAFQLYRRDPMTYLLISALCYAPILVMQLVVLGPAMAVEAQITRLTSGFSVIMMLAYWVSLSLMSAAIVRISAEDYLGNRVEPAVAVRDALTRLPAVMFGLLFKYILMFVGIFVFLIGMFYVIARYFAVTSAIVIEHRGLVTAFGRSSTLSR